MKSFSELGLNDNIVKGLELQGITEPTEIQSLTIPEILKNKDVIGESFTGSGKTLAFLAPIFQKINTEKREMQVLIIQPTHELVMQTEAQIKMLAVNSNVSVTSLTLIGDVNIFNQIKKLKEIKPHIIVGTPGRVLDLMNKKKISAHTIKTIVIDEADNLLDNTSSAFVKDIIKKTMKDREILIFSATINKNTLETAKALMKDPVIFKNESNFSLNPVIEHMYIETDPREKSEVLRKLTSAINLQKAVVFVNNVYNIDLVAERLNYHNKNAFAMHNKLTKEQRQNAMEKFRKGQIKILVSSDISARG
ncbi:MAG: DEAD/DEAH box helicase, partial [Clostridiales bacterium]|nr:DEAD/DEAH box helicase [Clostridiales bacterium]